jgi:hypothetical protein
MAYLGKVELKASDIRAIAPGVATHLQTDIVLNWLAPNVQSLIVTINGVKQETDSYTITGTASSTVVLGVGMTLSDTYQVIGINDIGTTITPADGSVTLSKLSPGVGSAGQYLKTDGVSTLSWGSGGTIGDIITANNFFQNWNEISTGGLVTSTFASTINAAIIGPITVSGASTIWEIDGELNIL